MLKPCRNKIVFTGIPDEFTISLCNEELQKYIRNNSFVEGETYTLDFFEKLDENFKNITRSENTFHQNDDNIRNELYKILTPIFDKKYENVLLIGGECYIFGSLVNAKNIYSYSDSSFIVKDCKRNLNIYGGNIETELVNYGDVAIRNIEYDLCILNVSKKGLGKHLSSLINGLKIKQKYYISCNEKSFKIDGFAPIQKWEIRNPLYGITLYQI
jgi:hypothetical protein